MEIQSSYYCAKKSIILTVCTKSTGTFQMTDPLKICTTKSWKKFKGSSDNENIISEPQYISKFPIQVNLSVNHSIVWIRGTSTVNNELALGTNSQMYQTVPILWAQLTEK